MSINSRDYYLSNMEAINDTIKALPDNAIICSISRDYILDCMEILILFNPAVKWERHSQYDDGRWFCICPDYPIMVGCLADPEEVPE